MSGSPVPGDAASADAHSPPAPPPEGGNHPTAPGERAGRRRLAGLGALLVTLTALPAAVLAVPDATADVLPAALGGLGLGEARVPTLLHVTGLSLPALVFAVPPAGLAARRFPAWTVLATGLAVLLAGLGTARLAPSLPLVGLARLAQGAGAGIVLPASLMLAWERGDRRLTAAWAGVLAGMLVLAMPLALAAVPGSAAGAAEDGAWRAVLGPFPWVAVTAAGAALLRPLLRGRVPWRLPPGGYGERSLLLLPLAPAGGFGFLAVAAAHEWSPGARVVLAGLAATALLGLAAAAGRREPAGSPHGCAIVMIAVGLLAYPVAAPLADIAAAADGDGAAARLLPFAAAAAAAPAGALAATRLPARAALRAGFPLLVLALPLGLAAGAGPGPGGRWALLAPLVPLGAGAGLALAASLRGAAPGAALFGLSLCFPAVLAGQLLVLSLQAARLDRARPATGAEQVEALLAGYHDWLIAAGMAAVLLAAATAALTARRRNAASGARAG